MLFVLQDRLGIGYHEAYHVRPVWEIDNLLEQLTAEAQHADEADARQEMHDKHAEKLQRLGITQ